MPHALDLTGMRTEQERAWASDFGNEYTVRNRIDWRARMPFWHGIISQTGARSVSEFGCNAGWNLSAIKKVRPEVVVYGTDVNDYALEVAASAGLTVMNGELQCAELVFTAGVLIHIPPQDLPDVMKQIIEASYDYVLAVEYEAEEEIEIEYRGHKGRLWKRPFGKMYQGMGLKLVDSFKVGKTDGFDDCTAWLLRK